MPDVEIDPLEDLLNDTLTDFDGGVSGDPSSDIILAPTAADITSAAELDAAYESAESLKAVGASASSTEAPAAESAGPWSTAPALTRPAQPKGIGMGLGPRAKGSKGGPHSKNTGQHKSEPKLPDDLAKLANDLMKLVEDAGIGEVTNATEDPAHASSSGRTGTSYPAGLGGFNAEALKELSEQTKRTVAEQEKLNPQAAAAAAAVASANRGNTGARGPAGAGGPAGLGDLLSGLLGSESGGMSGLLDDAAANGGGMNFMVDYILQNLLSKEVLYSPLKDICEKYPPWLEKNKEGLPAEDFQRYKRQYESIQAVCHQYETDPSNFQNIVELIQQMQSYGDPPPEIVDEMSGGLDGILSGGAASGNGAAAAPRNGDPTDVDNFEVPPDFTQNLPKELQDCKMQ